MTVRIDKLIVMAFAAIFAIAWPRATRAGTADLVGVWRNIDTTTRGITHTFIRQSGDRLFIHAWGRCHPTDCDWGEVELHQYGHDARLPASESADAGVAVFDRGKSAQMLMVVLHGQQLEFHIFTNYDPNPRQNNYESVGILSK